MTLFRRIIIVLSVFSITTFGKVAHADHEPAGTICKWGKLTANHGNSLSGNSITCDCVDGHWKNCRKGCNYKEYDTTNHGDRLTGETKSCECNDGKWRRCYDKDNHCHRDGKNYTPGKWYELTHTNEKCYCEWDTTWSKCEALQHNPDSSPTSPTPRPTSKPTEKPSSKPSLRPTPQPTPAPVPEWTGSPTKPPSPAWTGSPTKPPSRSPTFTPTPPPTPGPTPPPSPGPTPRPTAAPTERPTDDGNVEPTTTPTEFGTFPTFTPSARPSNVWVDPDNKTPTITPTEFGTFPTFTPSARPSNVWVEDGGCETIAEFVCNNNEFSLLCAALTRLYLYDILNNPEGKYTFFAPNDTAFQKYLEQERVTEMTEINSDTMKDVLYTNIMAGVLDKEDLIVLCGQLAQMVNGKATRTFCTTTETDATDTATTDNDNNDGYWLYQKGRGNAEDKKPKLIATDIKTCNGIIHVVDHVILPAE
mmetsp:Transcript_31577/g.35418  ORF Transcript_31577/g.35418 Transcript_31577/m.35418 type:complete len:475 (-) Transcript_31577:330-1754(-)